MTSTTPKQNLKRISIQLQNPITKGNTEGYLRLTLKSKANSSVKLALPPMIKQLSKLLEEYESNPVEGVEPGMEPVIEAILEPIMEPSMETTEAVSETLKPVQVDPIPELIPVPINPPPTLPTPKICDSKELYKISAPQGLLSYTDFNPIFCSDSYDLTATIRDLISAAIISEIEIYTHISNNLVLHSEADCSNFINNIIVTIPLETIKAFFSLVLKENPILDEFIKNGLDAKAFRFTSNHYMSSEVFLLIKAGLMTKKINFEVL